MSRGVHCRKDGRCAVGFQTTSREIILEILNVYNFARQFVAMGDLLLRQSRKTEALVALKRQVTEVTSEPSERERERERERWSWFVLLSAQ